MERKYLGVTQLPDEGWSKQITSHSLDWVQEIPYECLFRNKLKLSLDLEAASLDQALEDLCYSSGLTGQQAILAVMPPQPMYSPKNPTGP